EQAAVEVEDVAGVRLAARRAAEEQRELAVGGRLLAEVVVDEERVAAGVAEVLAHRAARVGSDELQRRALGGAGHDDRRVLHRAVLGELGDDLRDRGLLLADRHVEAVNALALLVDDRVDRDGRLAGLAVADDQLALTAADRDHPVDGLETGLQRLLDRLALDDAGRLELDAAALLRLDRALAVDRLAERVDHAAEQGLADRNVEDAPGALDGVALADLAVGAENGHADVVLFEVEHHAHQAAAELDELARHGALEAIDARDAVTDGEDRAGLHHVDGLVVGGDLLLDDLGDLFGAELHGRSPVRASGTPIGRAKNQWMKGGATRMR